MSRGAGVAQLVERGAVNPVVGGSNPPPGAFFRMMKLERVDFMIGSRRSDTP